MSPEYALRGVFSEKSDVFSFGVLLLEIISGKKNSSFHYVEENLNLLNYVSAHSLSDAVLINFTHIYLCLEPHDNVYHYCRHGNCGVN